MDIRIALAGNPNSGKTTTYNALTGKSEYVGNWAGVTVEKKESPLLVRLLRKTKSTAPIRLQVKILPRAKSVVRTIGVATTDLTAKNVVVAETKTDTPIVRTTVDTTIMMKTMICRSTKER